MPRDDTLELKASQGVNSKDIPKNIREYLIRTMGKESFTLCKMFFESVWNSGAPYKVFMARRCMNLMYLFYRGFVERNSEELEKTFFTDQALLSNVREIAGIYEEMGFIPRILLMDEILLHGRTINEFVEKLIKGICRCLNEDGFEYSRREVESEVFASVRIRVIMQSSKGILLDRKLWGLLRSEKICDLEKLHQFSSRVSQVIADGMVTNTSFVPSLNIMPDAMGAELYSSLTNNAMEKMTCSSYQGRFLDKAWVYPLTSLEGEVKAIYTLRVVSSAIDGAKRVIPFVILPNIKNFKRTLFALLDGKASLIAEKAYRYWGDESPAGIEAFIMILSQNLLLLLLESKSIMKDDLLLNSLMDYNKIHMTFRSHTPSVEAFYEHITKRRTPWITWKQMDQLLLELTQNSDPLFSLRRYGRPALYDQTSGIDYDDLIKNSVSNMVAQFGIDSEIHAYRQYIRKEYPSGRKSCQKYMAEVLLDLDKQIGYSAKDRRHFLIYTVSVLLRYMDIGALSVTASCLSNGSDVEYCSLCGVGEQALFIMPFRHFKYLTVLELMECDSQEDIDCLIRTIKRWFFSRINKTKAMELVEFVRSLYDMGQRVKDWNIDLKGWFDWNKQINVDKFLTPMEIRSLNVRAEIDAVAEQNNELYQYIKR